MTIHHGHPARERRLRRLPEGDPGRITALTRIIWADERDMDIGDDGQPENAAACLDEDGTEVIVIREGLAADVQRGEIKRLRAELRGLGASRHAAWTIVTAEGLRQFGWRYLALRASAITGGHAAQIATAAVVATATVTTATVFAIHHGQGGITYGSPAWHRKHPVHVTLPEQPLSYLGAFEQTSPNSYGGMETFARTAGRQPNVALYYSGWWEPFQMSFAAAAADHGAIPFVEINPEVGTNGRGISLAEIANGAYDDYLINYADAVATYHKAVIIGFGHEMNGTWYPWGRGHQSPADFVAAWRHIVDVFRMQGADNVTWLWTVNEIGGKKPAPLSQWWPGENYVTWVGIDGYYRHPDDTWSSVFAPTVAAVQQLTGDPILIAETAIGPVGTEPWQLNDMYASIRQDHYLGLVWFDENWRGLQYRLEGDAPAVAVFQQETKSWRLTHQRGPDTKDASTNQTSATRG